MTVINSPWIGILLLQLQKRPPAPNQLIHTTCKIANILAGCACLRPALAFIHSKWKMPIPISYAARGNNMRTDLGKILMLFEILFCVVFLVNSKSKHRIWVCLENLFCISITRTTHPGPVGFIPLEIPTCYTKLPLPKLHNSPAKQYWKATFQL